jgi:hypothetical protein
MAKSARTLSANQWIEKLAAPSRVADLAPIAARFLYSLRLIAVHEHAGRDPVPELACRLGNVELAAKALAMSQAICTAWPENITLSRFCCGMMSHDEATIGSLIERAAEYDSVGFERVTSGLIRHQRVARLWDAALCLVSAEANAV